jgi:hypothetical protein
VVDGFATASFWLPGHLFWLTIWFINLCLSAGGTQLSVDGAMARAVLIVSAKAIAAQTHPCTLADDCLDDAANYDGNTAFVMPSASATNNDKLVVVSP